MFKTLLKINIKSLFSTMFRRKSTKPGRSAGSKAGRVLLVLLLSVYALGVMMVSIGGLFSSLVMQSDGTLTEPRYYFSLLGILMFCLAFIGGVFSTKNLLFRARDNQLLLSMPIPPFQILASRVAVLLVLETIYTLLIALPAGFVWFRATGFSLPLLLRLLLCTLLLLFFAAAVTGFFGWLLALLDTKFAKSEMIQSFLSLALLVGYMLVCFNMQNYVATLSANQAKISAGIRRALPLFDLYGHAVGGSLPAILGLTVAALLPFALICLLLSRSFFKLSTGKKATRHRTKLRAQSAPRTPRTALLIKEVRQFFSMPLYLLNCGFGCMMEVLIAVLMFFKRETILDMVSGVEFCDSRAAVPLITIGFCITTINTTAVSLSLERKRIDPLRAMPLDAQSVYAAKLGANLVIGLPTTLLGGLLTGVAMRLPPLQIALIAVCLCVTLLLISSIQLTANIMMPKFDAISDAVLIKQSGSVLVSMLLSFAAGLTLLLLAFGLMTLLGTTAALAVMIVLIGAACAIFRHWFRHGAVRRYEEMTA